MREDRSSTDGPDDIAEVVDALLEALGRSFDLDEAAPGGTLGEAVRQRLVALDVTSPPVWGTAGSMSQVARQEAESLDFYYRPHLFPDMSAELRLAHHLQFDLLPRRLPPSSPLKIAAVLESYCHLSGDLLGWRQEEDGFLLWVVDIAGHGVRAGLAAAVFHFLIAGTETDSSLADLARRLNDRMLQARNPTDRRALYATAFMVKVGPDGRCVYASAGHPPMMHRLADGSVSRLPAQGPPIGLIPSQTFRQHEFRLEAEDTLFLYTDGLLEARSPDGEEFGIERIEELVRKAPARPLDLSRAAYRRIRDHKATQLLDDDLTFLAARLA